MARRILAVVLLYVSVTIPVFAGPPFRTDDPEPVEYKHWEIYVASQGSFDRNSSSFTVPHIEVNYGVVSNVQLHMIAPLGLAVATSTPTRYGFSDIELGAKYRFIQETDSRPQVGTFPLLLLPTGKKDNGLGSGEVQVFLPLWVQKSWDSWTTYGGAGYWINPGTGNKNYWLIGWLVQRDISEFLTLGTEVFHQTPSEIYGKSSTGFNFGAMINFGDLHHVLLSAGRNFWGTNEASYYASYQLTFGPS